MKNFLGIVVTLVCFSSLARADYWSVGSYSVLANATTEQSRLSRITGLSVEIATFNIEGVNTYRLVVEKDDYPAQQRQKIMDAGISPWTISIDNEALDSAHEGRQEIATNGMDFFLVVAGYRRKVQADLALSKFAGDGIDKLKIEETTVASAPWFRILHGPFDAPFDTVLSEIRGHGITDAWWVKREPVMVRPVEVPAPKVSSIPEGIAESEPVEIPISKPEVNPPRPNESYFNYCIKKANALERAVYCADGSFSGLIVAEKNSSRMDEGPKALAEFCAVRASPREREKYCTD